MTRIDLVFIRVIRVIRGLKFFSLTLFYLSPNVKSTFPATTLTY